jgi:hypothetical protein
LPVVAGLDSGYLAVKDAYMTSETGSVVGIARQEPDLSFRLRAADCGGAGD